MMCRRIHRWIEDEASGVLPPRLQALLAEHLRACDACRSRRERTVMLGHTLTRMRASAPVVDVRERVLAEIQAGARACRPVRLRRFWGIAGAGVAAVAAMLLLVGASVVLFSAQPLPARAAAWRLLRDTLSTAWSLAVTAGTLLTRLAEAIGQTAFSLAPLLPFVEVAAAVLLALTLIVATLPVARALWPAAGYRRSSRR